MNIIRADFDWTSLLVIVVAGIFGLIKSQAKKGQGQERRMAPSPEYPTEETEKVEWFSDHENEVKDENKAMTFQDEKTTLSGDYYKQPEEDHIADACPSELPEEKETYENFDLRKAIISSEILRRPEY